MARARSLAEEEKRLRKKQEEEREALRAKQREEQARQEELRRQEQEKLLKLREEFIEKTKKALQFTETPSEKPEKGKKVLEFCEASDEMITCSVDENRVGRRKTMKTVSSRTAPEADGAAGARERDRRPRDVKLPSGRRARSEAKEDHANALLRQNAGENGRGNRREKEKERRKVARNRLPRRTTVSAPSRRIRSFRRRSFHRLTTRQTMTAN